MDGKTMVWLRIKRIVMFLCPHSFDTEHFLPKHTLEEGHALLLGHYEGLDTRGNFPV